MGSLFEDPLEPSATETEDDRLIALVDEYVSIVDRIDGLKERAEFLRATIGAHFPEDIGNFSRIVTSKGRRVVLNVRRNEKMTWSTDELRRIAGMDVPPYPLMMKLSVAKREFDGLDADTQRTLLPALTRAPGAAHIIISEAETK